MKRIHGVLAGLLVLGSVLTFDGIAQAQTYHGTIYLEDGPVKAGQKVVVGAICKGFTFTSSPVESPVLDSEDLRARPSDPLGISHANAKVRENTKPGTYPIAFWCGGGKGVGHFVVVGDPQAPVVKKPGKQVAKVPVGAPRTGGGGEG